MCPFQYGVGLSTSTSGPGLCTGLALQTWGSRPPGPGIPQGPAPSPLVAGRVIHMHSDGARVSDVFPGLPGTVCVALLPVPFLCPRDEFPFRLFSTPRKKLALPHRNEFSEGPFLPTFLCSWAITCTVREGMRVCSKRAYVFLRTL